MVKILADVSLSTSADDLTVGGTIELGNATDTTLSRSAAGTLAVEGVDVVTTSATQTLTNKSLTSPSLTQVTIGGGDTTTSTDTASINAVGYNQRGGAGYHGFLDVKNTFGSATNPKKFFRLNSTGGLEIINNAYTTNIFTLTDSGQLSVPSATIANNFAITTPVYGSYDKGGSADATTITTAGTYYALTNAEVSFTPQFVGQRFLLTFTAYASLVTTTIQYAFVRANITDASNTIVGSDLGFSRSDNYGQSGRGSAVAFTKIWVADTTSARKFKLYGTVQTTNGLTLSLAYTQMTVMSIN